jgi:hypothetical protein
MQMRRNLFKSYRFSKFATKNHPDLFGIGISEDFHWGKLFFYLFGQYYSKYRIEHYLYNELLIESLTDHYALDQSHIIRIDRAEEKDFYKVNYEWSEITLILKEGLLFTIYDNRVEILYSHRISNIERNELITHIEKYKVNNTIIKQFHMVKYYRGSFELANFDIRPFNIDIESNYNDDFQGINNLICKALNEAEKNGLILLHGKYGSGKTYYLRHLMSKIDRKFIYFPVNMVEAINSPEFLPFISEHPNSVLILEDCESLLIPRENGANNSSAISNLLNLGDGLLSDALSLNVICTFNAGIRKIDDAILRKGRLLARYEFKELEVKKAQTLAAKIGKSVNIEQPMTVSDIYNLDARSFENPTNKAVGFYAHIVTQ